jgi:hypothetical protein
MVEAQAWMNSELVSPVIWFRGDLNGPCICWPKNGPQKCRFVGYVDEGFAVGHGLGAAGG